jgi:hypothetical protein
VTERASSTNRWDSRRVRHDRAKSCGAVPVVHLEHQGDLVPAANHTSCYWRVSNADALHKEFAALGLPRDTDLTEPFDEPWGMREFTLKDPAGNLIRVGHELTNP